jgi:hypothetical protein
MLQVTLDPQQVKKVKFGACRAKYSIKLEPIPNAATVSISIPLHPSPQAPPSFYLNLDPSPKTPNYQKKLQQ